MPKTFVLTDGSENSYGFKIDMEKLRLERFYSNPVALYKHDNLVGRWTNIRLEDGKLLAEPEFMRGEGEELAEKVSRRVEKEFLKAASVGIHILAWSEVEGETPTVEAELMEASIVPIPANANAIALYDKDFNKLSSEQIELAIKPTQKVNNNPVNMKLNADSLEVLNLSGEPGASAIDDAIKNLHAAKTAAETKLKELQDSTVKSFLDKAEAEGRFLADERKDFEELAAANFELCQKQVNKLPVKKNLSSQVQPENTVDLSVERKEWSFHDWRKKDPKGLLSMKANDPDQYNELLSGAE